MADCKCTDRRSFLKMGGVGLVISAMNPKLVAASRDRRLEPLRELRGRSAHKTFIHIWLRGGQDGLNVCVPTNSTDYPIYQGMRPTLGLTSGDLAGTPLTGHEFALHPALTNGLHNLYENDRMAVMPTVGYADSSRSHFDSQKFIEVGVPWQKLSADGWLNRHLQTTPSSSDPLRAVSFTSGIPFELIGSEGVMSFTNVNGLAVSGNTSRDQKFFDSQGVVYGQPNAGRPYDAALHDAGLGLVSAIGKLRDATPLPDPAPAANYPNTNFGTNMMQLSQLIRAEIAGTPAFEIEVANVEIGGWDTHTQQGATGGNFSGLLAQVSDGIKAFVDDMDAWDSGAMDRTLILTVSEFGRTANENGNFGTDHGNAWCSFAVGNNVSRGVYTDGVFGGWPGLADLRDNRDLRQSIDFRDVYAEVLSKHMGSLDPAVFPGHTYTPVGFLP